MNNFDDILNNSPAGGQSAPLSREEYAARKKAERDGVFSLSDDTAMKVAGDGGVFRQYLDVQATFDRYSAVNTLLILAQKPEATRVGDFDYWKNQGGFVRPKQIGISILEPHEYIKEDGSPGTGYNIKKVFDISQVDARKIRQTPQPSYTERQLLAALVYKSPVKVISVEELPDGHGAMTNPEITEISVRKGMAFADIFRSVAQELAYAALSTGLDTQTDVRFSAYSAAYILCKKYGVDVQDFNFDAAPGLLSGMDAQGIKGELSQIRDVAADISGRMSRQLEAVQRAEKNQEAR